MSIKTLILADGSPSAVLAVAGLLKAHGITSEEVMSGRVQIVFTQSFKVGEDSEARKAVETLPGDGLVIVVGMLINS